MSQQRDIDRYICNIKEREEGGGRNSLPTATHSVSILQHQLQEVQTQQQKLQTAKK